MKLSDEENNLKALFQMCEGLMWIKDTNGRYKEVSDSLLRACGKSREEVIGTTDKYVWDLQEEPCTASDEKVLATGEIHRGEEILPINGRKRIFKVEKGPVFDKENKIIGTVGIATDITDLNSRQKTISIIIEDLPYAIVLLNQEQEIVQFNKKMKELFHIDDSVIGKPYEVDEENFEVHIENEKNVQIFAKGASNQQFVVHTEEIIDNTGELEGYLILIHEITEEAKKVKEEYFQKFSNALTSAYSEIYQLDYEKNSFEELYNSGLLNEYFRGYDLNLAFEINPDTGMFRLDKILKGLGTTISPLDMEVYEKMIDPEYLKDIFSTGKQNCEHDIRILKSSGEYAWINFIISKVEQKGSDQVYLYCIKDINEIKQSEQDSLSDVFNRRAFVRQVEEQLGQDVDGYKVMFMMDIDDFKMINDTYGHKVGDEVIHQVGTIIKKRFQNKEISGRLGGDEFAVFLCNVGDEHTIEEGAKGLVEDMRKIPQELKRNVVVTGSIGVVYTRRTDITFDQLYIAADDALYKAKRNRKNQSVIEEI